MDFTILKYIELLNQLVNHGYDFQTFKEFIEKPMKRVIILRHDVDRRPLNSLRFARIQHELGIKGTYYFRAVPESWDKGIIIEIASLGHEIGYHYENMANCKGNIDKAIKDFEEKLRALRELVPVTTICMHGSPLSKYDAKVLWTKYNYRNYDLIGEPYFDIDFNKVLYLTDTGRQWDGHKYNVRDKINTGYNHSFHSTDNIIESINKKELLQQIMINMHPQRWHENYRLWIYELLFQKAKNVVKYFFYV